MQIISPSHCKGLFQSESTPDCTHFEYHQRPLGTSMDGGLVWLPLLLEKPPATPFTHSVFISGYFTETPPFFSAVVEFGSGEGETVEVMEKPAKWVWSAVKNSTVAFWKTNSPLPASLSIVEAHGRCNSINVLCAALVPLDLEGWMLNTCILLASLGFVCSLDFACGQLVSW